MSSATDFYQNPFVREFIREGQKRILRTQLSTKFGRLPQWAEGRINRASTRQIERWALQLFTAPTLEGVLGTPSHSTSKKLRTANKAT